MAPKKVIHRGSRSWWSGDVRTLCGLTLPAGDAKSSWLSGPNCPACVRAIRGGRK